MPLSPTQKTALQNYAKLGMVQVAEYMQVDWDEDDPSETRYYAISKYNQTSPFGNIGFNIEAKLLNSPFDNMEINPDLRTEEIPLVFDDIDKTIRARFKQFGSGVRCEIFFYFPQVNEHESFWFGQLQAPAIYGWKKQTTVATNGFRSREQKVPKRGRTRECPGPFGGHLTDEARASNGCDYNPAGGIGNYRTGTTPFLDCTYDETGCTARGMISRFLGYNADPSAVVTDGNSGYLAVSKGNASALTNTIRAIYGTKLVRGLQLLWWRREMNASNQDRGFVAGVWENGEGPLRSITNFKVGEKLIEQMHQAHRLGTKGQQNLFQYAPNISNYSSTSVSFARKGWVDPLTENAQTMTAEARIEGLTNVPSLNSAAAGQGLVGNYYSDRTFTSLFGTRIDPTIYFPSQYGGPLEGLEYNNFSIRWTGKIKPRYTENYTFTLTHDDRGKLYINDMVTPIINKGFFEENPSQAVIALTADVEYDIKVEVIQDLATGQNFWSSILQWQSASQALEVVPSTRLSNSGSSGLVRQFTNDRLWCLLDQMTNSKFGLSNPFSRFNAQRWSEASYWGRQNVRFQLVNVDGETRNFDHTRTQFDCVVEGRPVAEQVVDICRSGRISVPFQHQGLYEIAPFRAFTDAELAAAPTFYDSGPDQNVWWSDGAPFIQLETTPNDRIPNEIKLVFEDGANGDNARTITIKNPDQQKLAGRALGGGNLQEATERYAAFGIRNLNEAVKLGWGIEKFGVFDEGGSKNNGRLRLRCPLVWALDVKRYGPIRVISQIVTDDDAPKLPNGDTMEYFRVLKIVKISKDAVEIIAQVYNHAEYSAFETLNVSPPPGDDPPPWPPPDPGDPPPDPFPFPLEPQTAVAFQSASYDPSGGFIVVEVNV